LEHHPKDQTTKRDPKDCGESIGGWINDPEPYEELDHDNRHKDEPGQIPQLYPGKQQDERKGHFSADGLRLISVEVTDHLTMIDNFLLWSEGKHFPTPYCFGEVIK